MADDDRRVPGYARPSMSSKLPSSVGLEHEVIKAAFAPGSYTSIGGLGRSPFLPDEGSSVSSSSEQVSFRTGGQKSFFEQFEYSVSPYDIAAEIQSRQRKDHKAKVGNIGNGEPFVAPGVAATLKHEGSYPYETDPFDTVKDEILRGKWLEERKVLAGAFVPSGRDKSLSKPSRALLTDIMAQLYKTLYEDWEELFPTVFNTVEDIIVIYFNVSGITQQRQHGLSVYMNIIAKRGAPIMRHDLRKVNEGWDVSAQGNHTMFAFRPPWVKDKKFVSFENANK